MRRPDVFTLDYSHPLAQGLATAWMGRFPGVQRSFDEITGKSAAIVGSAEWSDIFGRAGVYAKAAGAAVIVPRPAISSSDTHTISWSINARGSSYNTGSAAYGRHFEDANMSFNFYSTAGNQFQLNAFGISASIPLADSIYNIPTVFSIVVGPSNARLIKDGVQVSSSNGTKTSAPAANTYLLNRADLGRTCNAGISDFLIHNRGLSDAELMLLANVYDPMLGGLVREVNPVAYFDFGGSSAGTDALTAADLVTGSPVLGTPALGQVHALTATALTVSSPVLGSPSIGQIHSLVAPALVVGSPVLGTPSLSENAPDVDALTAVDLVVGSPVLGTPSFGQIHVLGSDGLTVSSPVLGTPSLEIGKDHLAAQDLATECPVLGTPALMQIHALVASFSTAAPEIGAPVLTQAHAVIPANLAVGSPVLGTPMLFDLEYMLQTRAELKSLGTTNFTSPLYGATHIELRCYGNYEVNEFGE